MNTNDTTPPAAASDAAIALRELAGIIRKHGTCAPMALEVIAERLEAAPPIAQQGGGEVDAIIARLQGITDSGYFGNAERAALDGVITDLTAALASKADGGESKVRHPDPEIDMLTEEESRRLSAGLPMWPVGG